MFFPRGGFDERSRGEYQGLENLEVAKAREGMNCASSQCYPSRFRAATLRPKTT